MGFNLEIKYYNSFWLKQVTTPLIFNNSGLVPKYVKLFPGIPFLNNTNNSYPNFPTTSNTAPYSNVWPSANAEYNFNNGSNWIIEESRIRGGFNNNQLDLGVRAYLKEDSNDVRYRSNALIYSGVFNSRTNINNTNIFSVAEDITKAVDPHNGSVQFLHAMDNNLTIFQENKVSQALIDKDAIYSAEGTPIKAISNIVIGQVTPYTGDYGISRNPESFANFGFRRYFADKDRNAVMRLSRDGLTEISQYGMKDYFRDELVRISDRSKVNTISYVLDYNPTAGTITQGPQVPDAGGAAIPTPLGPWVKLVNRGEDDYNDITIGSQVQINLDPSGTGTWTSINSFVTGTGTISISGVSFYAVFLSNGPLQIYSPGVTTVPEIRFCHYKKDKIEGGFDNYKDNYTVSLQRHSGSKTTDDTSDYYNTLTFDETVSGWTTFYTYRPNFMFSLKNNFFTTKNGSLYLHYDAEANANEYYGIPYNSSVTFVFNDNPSINKNFKTINYEGSTGWQIDSFVSDTFTLQPNVSEDLDQTNTVKSYEEGLYTEGGVPYRAGFYLKDNKYYANLVNNSEATPGEVVFGSSMTGIKGHFATVKISTDSTTRVGGTKELFAVSTEFVVSSR
tara:strand:- start:1667 stop:3517 length:1851 start_codon:yes stop_codon:yes gene_type:complete